MMKGKVINRFEALLMCFVMMVTMISLPVITTVVTAATNETNLVEYPVKNGSIFFDTKTGYITKADAYITSAVIPKTINGITVKGIGELAFDWCRDLASVTLPDTIEEIGEYAFRQCDSLQSIEIPQSVKTIGEHAFIYSGLTSVVVPDSVTSMGEGVFEASENLRTAVIGKGLKALPDNTFGGCNKLENVYLPDTISVIGKQAFADTGLEEFTLPSGVTEIRENAFGNCQELTVVNLNEGLKIIRDEAFIDCYKMQIRLPSTLEILGTAAFEANLTDNIQVASGNKYFMSLDGVLYSKDMKKLIQYPLGKTDTVYTVPEGVTQIGAYAFGMDWGHHLEEYTHLEKVILPVSVTSIGEYAFSDGDKLTQIVLPDNLKTIGDYAFAHTNIADVNLPEGLTQIGTGAFFWCEKLKAVNVPSTVQDIPEYCFYGCTSLKKAVLAEGVRSLGRVCFDYTDSLEIITTPKSVTYCDLIFAYGNRIGNHPLPITIEGYVNSAVYEWYLMMLNDYDSEYNLVFKSLGTVTPADHEHDFSKYVSNGDGTHKTVCTECGKIQNSHDKDNCTGGKATCIMKAVCSVCGAGYGEKNLTNHVNTEIRNAKNATCAVDGYTGDTYCKDCGVRLSTGSVTNASGNHKWDAGKITKKPEIGITGIKTYTCTICKATKTETVPALNNDGFIPGDVNNDGEVTVVDARLALHASIGLESYKSDSREFKAANVDKVGEITVSDARLILRAAIGLEDIKAL